jgi:hypothetical protein
MPGAFRLLLAMALLFVPLMALADTKQKPATTSVAAVVETTLTTDGEQIRQLAFDGDAKTFFASEKNASGKDHFSLRFDKPVAVQSLLVTTGRPEGGDKLDAGTVEVSADGQKFETVAKFTGGEARAQLEGRKIQTLRIKPLADLKHPLAIREIVVESNPAVSIFKYPVEFIVDVRDAPEMKEWTDKVVRICERQYTMINDELKSDGFKPRRLVRMKLSKDYRGVAMAGGGRITGAVKYFKDHPNDIGAMVHETVHIVQDYRVRGNPGWLVEGVADYIRFFKYEPGKLGSINPQRAHYNGSYRVTAAFLAYVTAKYDKQLVRKLNKMMRAGEYKEEAFKTLTGKTLPQLDQEWRASLGV